MTLNSKQIYMKIPIKALITAFAVVLISCGGKEEKKESFTINRTKSETEKPVATETSEIKASERIVLDNKGIGPIKSLSLSEEIDEGMAATGKEVYDQLCLACHRIGKKFIGPAPNGILERRSPEWVMNMILNPEVMVKEDPLAKELFIEYNGSPMANQGLTEDQARAVLEYFRTLK